MEALALAPFLSTGGIAAVSLFSELYTARRKHNYHGFASLYSDVEIHTSNIYGVPDCCWCTVYWRVVCTI